MILVNSEEIRDTGTSKQEEKEYFIINQIIDYSIVDNHLYLESDTGQVGLEFITAEIVRVVLGQPTEVEGSTSAGVVEHNYAYDQFTVEETEEELLVTTDALEITISKQTFALSFYDRQGNLIHQDCRDMALGWNKEEVRAWKELKAEERFYGLGEKTGWLDKRGKEYRMWNHDTFEPHVETSDPLYQSIPFLIGFDQGLTYGIYFDNTYQTHFDLGKAGKDYYSFWAESGKLDYYFIYGPEMKEVIAHYTNLTGRMPLPPKWALGYHQSRYSYYPESEVRDLAATFREEEIPCDAIHFDIHYMDDYKIFTWDQQKFPQVKKLLNDLGAAGFKPVTIIDPGVKTDPRYEVYQSGIEKDCFCKYLDGELYTGKVWPGECVFPDFTQQETRDWWANLHQEFVEQGVKGIWNDMNEPAVFNDTDTIDLDVMHQNDGDSGTHDQFHNLYGLLECQATYQGLKDNLPDERPFVLTRAGFAGIQRYSAVWTGDNRSFWEHLDLAMPMLMNLGLSGVVFSGTDVGGFTGDTNGELLARWTQLGTFMPFFRNHCEVRAIQQEPWCFAEEYQQVIKKYIELRYKFLQHLYNLFYQASQTGLPVMRPLVLEYPEDETTYNLSDQFIVGENILVAPVYEPDTEHRMVYLPAGGWYDYWTGEFYAGEQHIIAEAPLDRLPMYVQAGAIIPKLPVQNYVGEKELEKLKLEIYLGAEENQGEYSLYEDDGISFAYQDGQYNLKRFSYQQEADKIKFTLAAEQINYQTSYDKYQLQFKGLAAEPTEIIVDREELAEWEYKANYLQFTVSVSTSSIEIVF